MGKEETGKEPNATEGQAGQAVAVRGLGRNGKLGASSHHARNSNASSASLRASATGNNNNKISAAPGLKLPGSSNHAVQTSNGSLATTNRGLRRTPEELEAKRSKKTGASSSPGATNETVLQPQADLKMATYNLTPHPEDANTGRDPSNSIHPGAMEEGTLSYPPQPEDRVVTGNNLAVASPVDGSSRLMHLEEAQEVDPKKLEGLTPEQEKTRDCKRNGLIALILVAAIVTLAIAFGMDTSKTSQEPAMVTGIPTMSPTTSAPTLAPTTLLGMDLPETTQGAVANNPLSPQAKAYGWLSNHPRVQHFKTWQRQQLFALATFYYALDGDHWPPIVKRSWLDYNIHECYWFSQEFLDSEKEYYLEEAVGATNITADICTAEGQYTTLALSLLDFADHHDSIVLPPELGWLSSLEALKIDISNANAELSDLLLSQDGQAILPPNVTTLSLFYNKIVGSIPTEIAEMQALNYLDISKNKLTGTIPADVGRMTNLGELYLWDNSISGSLPTELGSLGGVHRMDLSGNALTSTLPTEINAMTSLEWLWIRHNNLEGTLAGSDLGGLTNLIGLYLQDNALTGPLDNLITPEWAQTHSELMRYLHLASNDFESTIPTQIGVMTHLKQLNLSHAGLTGSIPSELGLLNATNNQISLLGNDFEGELPIELCPWICMDVTSPFALQEFLETSLLVASDQCNCTVGTTYPLNNVTNELVINVRFDEYPEETEWVLEKLIVTPQEGLDVSLDNNTTTWAPVDTELGVPEQICQLVSYKHTVTSNTLYHFYVMDAFGDGNCCNHGLGGVSITNGTIAVPEVEEDYNPYKGTILWNSWDAGFADYTETYVWVDAEGQTTVVSAAEGLQLAMETATSTAVTSEAKSGEGRA